MEWNHKRTQSIEKDFIVIIAVVVVVVFCCIFSLFILIQNIPVKSTHLIKFIFRFFFLRKNRLFIYFKNLQKQLNIERNEETRGGKKRPTVQRTNNFLIAFVEGCEWNNQLHAKCNEKVVRKMLINLCSFLSHALALSILPIHFNKVRLSVQHYIIYNFFQVSDLHEKIGYECLCYVYILGVPFR